MTVRRMTVVRTPGTDDKAMIRLTSNTMLTSAGFTVGTEIEVTYERNIITIKTLNHEHHLQAPTSPLPLPVAFGASDAGEIYGHVGRSESNPTAVTKAVPTSPQPLRYILAGSWHYVGS